MCVNYYDSDLYSEFGSYICSLWYMLINAKRICPRTYAFTHRCFSLSCLCISVFVSLQCSTTFGFYWTNCHPSLNFSMGAISYSFFGTFLHIKTLSVWAIFSICFLYLSLSIRIKGIYQLVCCCNMCTWLFGYICVLLIGLLENTDSHITAVWASVSMFIVFFSTSGSFLLMK